MERSGRGLTEILSQNFPVGTEKIIKPLSHDSRYPYRDSKLESHECKSKSVISRPTCSVIWATAVTLLICIWNVSCSNLGMYTKDPD